MTSGQPRLRPLPEDQWEFETRRLLERIPLGADGEVLGLFRTWAHHVDLLRRYLPFGHQLLFGGVLPARDRELLILRTAWNTGAEFEWGHHVPMAKASGITDAELKMVAVGPDSPELSEPDRLLLHAADEIIRNSTISDATWRGLSAGRGDPELIEIVVIVGHYLMLAALINALGVANDSGIAFPRENPAQTRRGDAP